MANLNGEGPASLLNILEQMGGVEIPEEIDWFQEQHQGWFYYFIFVLKVLKITLKLCFNLQVFLWRLQLSDCLFSLKPRS